MSVAIPVQPLPSLPPISQLLNVNVFAAFKKLFITDGAEHTLTGYCMYFLRANTKRTLGEETFQRDILAGLINATQTETLLWNIERTFSNIFIPFLNSRATADRISEELFRKVKQELNPCLRSFARYVFAANILLASSSYLLLLFIA